MWVMRVCVQANIGAGHLKNTSQKPHCLEQLVRKFVANPCEYEDWSSREDLHEVYSRPEGGNSTDR
jgi:hypothetical protein